MEMDGKAEAEEKENLEKFIKHGFSMFSSTLQKIKDDKEALNLSLKGSVASHAVGGFVGVVVAAGLHCLSMGGASAVSVAVGTKAKSITEILSLYCTYENCDTQQKNILSWMDKNETKFLRTVAEGLTHICIAFKDQINRFYNSDVNNDIFFKDVFRRIFNYMKNNRRNKHTPMDSKEFYNAFINGRSSPQVALKEKINPLNWHKVKRGLEIDGKENEGKLNTEKLFEATGLMKYDAEAIEEITLVVHEVDVQKTWQTQDFRFQFDFEENIVDENKRILLPDKILEETIFQVDNKNWRLNKENVQRFVENISRKLILKKELGTKWWQKPQALPNTFYERKGDINVLIETMNNILAGKNNGTSTDKNDSTKNKLVLTGFVGVGKTALAKRYAQTWGKNYEHIIWIDCTGECLKKSFTTLADKLKISGWDKMNLTQVATNCFKELQDFLCLWIFDNAKGHNCKDGIKEVLPEENENFHVIITSRNKEWGSEIGHGEIPKIEINAFTDEEAMEFMKTNLDQMKFNEQKMKFLIQLLGNLPLALQIALKYLTKKKKSLSDLIEMTKEKAGIIEENFDDYKETIKGAMKVYLNVIDPERNEKEKLACKMLSYFGYIRPDDVNIDFFRSVVNSGVVNGAHLLEDYSLVTESEKEHFSIHRLLQLVIRHNTDNKKRDEVLQTILNCQNFNDYKLIPYFFSSTEIQNQFPNIKSELIDRLDLQNLFLERKFQEAELLSRLIYYDAAPPTEIKTYNYALCLQHNQDADDAIVLLEHLYDNVTPTINSICHTGDEPAFGILSSQDNIRMEILAGYILLSYFNNNNNEEEKINAIIQNSPAVFQCNSNFDELFEFLTRISNVKLKYDGKSNCVSLQKYSGKKFELSNCQINTMNILLDGQELNLQELELCNVNTTPSFFQVLNNYRMKKLIFRYTTVDMSHDLTVEEVTLDNVNILFWNTTRWRINQLTLMNVDFLNETEIAVNNLTIWNSSVDCSILPKSLTKIILNQCSVQPVVSCSPLAIKFCCPLLQECTFQSVTFKDQHGKYFTKFDISYSIQSNFSYLKMLTLDCSSDNCTKLSVSVDCLCSVNFLALTGCDLILSCSNRLRPKELTIKIVRIIDNAKQNINYELVNGFTDFSQIQKLNLQGMNIDFSNNGNSSLSEVDNSNFTFTNELQELTLKNMTLSATDTIQSDSFANSSSIFNYLNKLTLQGPELSVSLRHLTPIASIHLKNCSLNVFIAEDLRNEYVKPKPRNLVLENIKFIGDSTDELKEPSVNDLFNFSQMKNLKLDGAMSIDLSDNLIVDEVFLKSVKVLNWKNANWKINNLTLENVNKYEESQLSVQELLIDGVVHVYKQLYKKLAEGFRNFVYDKNLQQRNDTRDCIISNEENFSVTAMVALRIKKILQNYADLEQKWKTVAEALDLSEEAKEELNRHGGGFGTLIFKTLKFWRIKEGKKAMFRDFVTVIRNNAENELAADELLKYEDEIRAAELIAASKIEAQLKHETKKSDNESADEDINQLVKPCLITKETALDTLQDVQKDELDSNKTLDEVATQKNVSGSKLTVLKTQEDMRRWLNEEVSVKILLKSGTKSESDIHSKFKELSNRLSLKDIETGFTLPNVENIFTLVVKTKTHEESYPADLISFVIDILLVAFDCPSEFSQTLRGFYQLAARLKNIQLPLSETSDEVCQLIEALRPLQKIKFFTTSAETMTHLNLKDDIWKVVIILDATISAYEATEKFIFLSKYFDKIFGEFLVGSFEIQDQYDAPLVFLFLNGELKAVILDTLDMFILDKLSKLGESIDASNIALLSTTEVEKSERCFYPKKLNYAKQVMSTFGNPFNEKSEPKLNKIFFPAENIFLQNAMKIVIGYLRSNKTMIISGMSRICHKLDEKIQPMISKQITMMHWDVGYKNYSGFLEELLQIYREEHSLTMKFMTTLDSLKSLHSDDQQCNDFLEKTINDYQWPNEMGNILIGYTDMALADKKENVSLILMKYFQKEVDEKKLQCSVALIQCLKIVNSPDFTFEQIKKELLDFLRHAIKQNIGQLFSKGTEIETRKENYLFDVIQECNFYKLAKALDMIQENDQLFAFKLELEKLNEESAIEIINTFAENEFNDAQNHFLWSDPKLNFFFKEQISNKKFIYSIHQLLCKLKIPSYLPDYIVKEMKLIFFQDHNVELPNEKSTFEEMRIFFQKILYSGTIPDDFGACLRRNLESNPELQVEMQNCDSLAFWNGELFTEAWSINTVEESLKKMNLYIEDIQRMNEKKGLKSAPSLHCNINIQPEITQDDKIDLEVLEQWVALVGTTLEYVKPEHYLKLRPLQEISDVKLFTDEMPIKKLITFFLQRLKGWGISVLYPQYLNNIMPTVAPSVAPKSSVTGMSARERMELRKQEKANTAEKKMELTSHGKSSSIPLSRIDILTIIIQSCSSTIIEDLLRTISQFPVSLPLVIPSVTKPNQFYFTGPLLKSVQFKWETGLKTIKHNSLFTNSFRMIAAVRLGESKPGKPGKSTILNQLFNISYLFSSLQEPGSFRGKPVSLPGLVEFVVLSQETCKESLWHSVVAHHYQTEAKDVILLANLHGDALNYPDTICLLKEMKCEFVMFLMAQDCDEAIEKIEQMEKIIEKNIEESSILVVDSSPEDIGDLYDDVNKIDTSQLTNDCTLEKVRALLKSALDKNSVCPEMPNFSSNVANIVLAENIATEESQKLIDYAVKNTCRMIKNTFKLQKSQNCFDFCNTLWNNDKNLRNLITMFANILVLPINLRRIGVQHLDREISRLSSNESRECREIIVALKEEFRSTIDLKDHQYELQTIKNKLTQEYKKLDTMSLGLEHFFRELGRIYEFAECINPIITKQSSVLLSMPKMCAELLVDGTAIEILDGDIGQINSSWFSSVCKHIHLKYPELSIFVISVLGLQSSGKSTLLNVLFGCKFAVSAGRCTRGLFMRLLFLDEALVKELGVDAIILIDTEGLGAPEKMSEANAEKNDRLMATFAMSISNLTIINVLGEAYRSLTEILQIVIITMARLDKAEMSPDVLMVQHVSERDESKLTLGTDKFCEALQEAIFLVSNESMKLGASECNSLKTLVERVRKGQLLKIFRGFKSGATINAPPSQEYLEDANSLYKEILQACKQSKKATFFQKWYTLIPIYWQEISVENFALNFKNIKDVQDFIDRDQKISQIKQAIYLAFQNHRDILEKGCRAKTNEELKKNSASKWNQMKEILFLEAAIDMKTVPHTCSAANNFPCTSCHDAVYKMNLFFKQIDNQYYKVEITSTIHKYISTVRASMITELKQMVKAMEVKLEKFTEFTTIINGILDKKLSERSEYNDIERQEIVQETWSSLRRKVSDENKIPSVEQRIRVQVRKVYSYNLNMEDAFYFPQCVDLCATKAAYFKVLTIEQASNIQIYLENLPILILKENSEEKYEDSMVKRLYDEIQNYIVYLEKQFNRKLSLDLKVKIHQNGLRIFTAAMNHIDAVWRSLNDPLVILQNKKKDYIDIINVRLQYGFNIGGEGRLMSDAVLKAIKKLSQNAAERKQRDLVLSQLWITNSENVRLKYFTKLAIQVDKGDKAEALAFFRSPKKSIEDWFTNDVNSFTSDSVLNEFTDTAQNEYEKMKSQFQSFECCKKIEECVLAYVRQVEGADYVCRMFFDEDSDVESLKKIIFTSLELGREDLIEDIQIRSVSMEKIVMDRLGCTDNCPSCGSLCWGERGHDQNADDTKKHHSNHQPSGLYGHHNYHSLKLVCISCDQMGENYNIYVNGRDQPPTLWKNVKLLPRYINWGYGTHFKVRFSNLMKWFLLQLHVDLARLWNLQPIDDDVLVEQGFTSIQLPHILSEMKSQI